MPKEQCNLIGSILAKKANWINEKIIIWLDNRERKEKKEYNRLESEFVKNRNKYTENIYQEIWARVIEEISRKSEQYIL